VWGALLSASAMHNNVDVAEIAAYTLFDLEESNARNYFTLCGIYSAVGRSDAVAGLRSRMRELRHGEGHLTAVWFMWWEERMHSIRGAYHVI
jgi:hypothetical protein